MSIVGLPPVLLRHCLVFRNLLNIVVRAGCLLRCDFLRRLVRAFGLCSILISVSLLKIVVTFAVNCQRPDLFQGLIKHWSNSRSSCCHRRLLLLVHIPHVERHRCSAQQLLFSLYRRACLVPVSCLSPLARVFLLSLLLKLAELGVRASLASVVSGSSRLRTRAWQSLVSAWSSTRFAPKSDGFPLFTKPAAVIVLYSDTFPRLPRSRDLTSQSLFPSAPGPHGVWRFLWLRRPPEVWADQATVPLKSSEIP